MHFTLESSNVSAGGTNLTGGEGDLARPDAIQGSFDVSVSGFTAKVNVVSVGGVFEAQLPFSKGYTRTNPANFGLTDPAQLLDPDKGLTSLLTVAQDPKVTGTERLGGELLDLVAFTVPGTDVPVLPDAAPSKPVKLVTGVDPANHQIRTINLTGPLTSATSDSTFVITLSNYDEHVTITLPKS